MDRRVHKRYLDYRERHVYFGWNRPLLSGADYVRLDAEAALLEAMGQEKGGEGRDDEEEQRYTELLAVLLRD